MKDPTWVVLNGIKHQLAHRRPRPSGSRQREKDPRREQPRQPRRQHARPAAPQNPLILEYVLLSILRKLGLRLTTNNANHQDEVDLANVALKRQISWWLERSHTGSKF
jgi:hypothetical protein